MPSRHRMSTAAVLAVGVLAAALLSGCSEQPGLDDDGEGPTASVTAAPTPSESAAEAEQAGDLGPVEAFLAWLEASRLPDVDEACAGLAPELVERMVAEMQQEGFADVTTCEEMMVVTADLYRAFGASAEVQIAVQSETETEAVLFVTYVDSGDCGTVVMERSSARWIITEQSQECAAA